MGALWCAPADVIAQRGCQDFTGDPGLLLPAIEAASDVLFIRSGRQFSTRIVTVRPCADPCAPGWHHSWGTTTSHSPGWCLGCSSSPSCSCGAGPGHLALAVGPLVTIAQVRLDGDVLVPGVDYRVDERKWLVRLPDSDDRPRVWPATQRLDLLASEDRTFEITALVGEPVPPLGVLAAAELACELNRLGDDECRLDPRVVSVQRQGLSFEVVGLVDALERGAIGLPMVDLFISTYNPMKLQRAARMVWPPPAGSARRTDTDGPS